MDRAWWGKLSALTVGVGALAVGSLVAPAATAASGQLVGHVPQRHQPAHLVPFTRATTFSTPPKAGSIIEPESAYPLALKKGYVEREFFASGRAAAYAPTPSHKDSKWAIRQTKSARYKTRILVRRPPKSVFNGTVIVEWMNVTEGESAPDWDYLNPMLMRDGYAYVAVSDQRLGVNGGKSIFGGKYPGLVGSEPKRYGSLHHPGDQYSLSIFDQIGAALQNPKTASHVLGGLQPKRVVATGESQSAYYLTTFANYLQPKSHAFDGIFIHSRGGGAAGFDGTAIGTGPNNVRIRRHVGVPVFMFETETDLITLGYATARQPNTPMIRTWEVAGTSHADSWIVGPYAATLGCTTPINTGPQHEVVQAAFTAFHSWVAHGTAPRRPHRLKIRNGAIATAPNSNARGGVRTPAVNVPISTLSGAAPPGASEVCSLFGSTAVFNPDSLTKLYGTRKNFVGLYRASLAKTIAKGYLLRADRHELMTAAKAVSFH